MDPADLVAYYPRLFHMTELASWPTIRRHGLLSVSALRDLFDASAEVRRRLERQRRPTPVRLRHPQHGDVLIRDQIPLQQAKLAACLVEMTVPEWLALLNHKVFFGSASSGSSRYSPRGRIALARTLC